MRKPLLLLMCAVACLLLIGCLSVTNLLICVAGGMGGLLLSLAASNWLAHAWTELPSAEGIRVDNVVLGFACAPVATTALVAGLLPAISSAGKAVFASLQSSSRTATGNLSSTALRKTLLTVEIAVTVILLIAAGLLLMTFLHLRASGLGCATENVLTMGSYLMTQRTTELGVRLALGAQKDQVLWLILFDGLRPAIIGLVVGAAASAGVTRLFRSMLYDTRSLDLTVYLAVIFTLLIVATLACMVPAWRASRLDPMQALRTE